VTLRVELVAPEGEIWSGNARMVIAKTLDGDLGVLTGHSPVLGILAEGSLIHILDPEGHEDAADQQVVAAISSGFLAVADDRVSILSRQAQLGTQVDVPAVQAELAQALEAEGQAGAGDQEPPEVRYSRALLRAAAGERA
jgi:F-type H+-transporting ATPase subunit epsilon